MESTIKSRFTSLPIITLHQRFPVFSTDGFTMLHQTRRFGPGSDLQSPAVWAQGLQESGWDAAGRLQEMSQCALAKKHSWVASTCAHFGQNCLTPPRNVDDRNSWVQPFLIFYSHIWDDDPQGLYIYILWLYGLQGLNTRSRRCWLAEQLQR